MTSILSSISGQFSKSLIMGTFFPVALFVILGRIFVAPLVPTDWPILKPLETLATEWQIVALLLLMIVLTAVLYNLNRPIIRFYEGYPWRNSWLGKRGANSYQTQFAAAHARWKGMRTLLRALPNSNENYDEILNEWNRIGRSINNDFPGKPSLVLPTRLGNVMRSYEYYPDQQYGIDSIMLWPPLIAKLDKDYAAGIDDAKSSFDFMINSSVLSALLALAILVTGLIYPIALTSLQAWRLWAPWLLEVAAFAALSYAFYFGSLSQASVRGALIKGAFDIYRWDLLKALGYKQEPATRQEERDLWDKISLHMLYGDTPTSPAVDYVVKSPPPTYAKSDAEDVTLEIERGIQSRDISAINVVIRVKNTNRRHSAQNVIVTDTLPDGFDYEWKSAHTTCHPVTVVGINPYSFAIGDLASGEETVLIYRAISRLTAMNDVPVVISIRSMIWRQLKRMFSLFM